MEHDFDNADGASPFRLGTGAEPGDSGVNADEKKRLTEFSSRYNGGKEPKSDIPERAKEPSRRDVSASFSNGQDHAERVDGPAISDGRQREKRRRSRKGGGKEREDVAARWWVYEERRGEARARERRVCTRER